MDQADRLRQLVKYKNNNDRSNNLLKVITVCSGKGGVGKTNISANLASVIRSEGFNVAILDADFGLANVNIMFGISAKHSIYDLLYSGMSIEDICIETKQGIRIIPGGSGIKELAEMSDEQQLKIINEFSKIDEDVLIIDTGAGISKNVIKFVNLADEVIVVTNPEPTALADAYGLIKVLSPLFKNSNHNVNILVNRALNQKEASEIYDRLEQTVNTFLNMQIKYAGFLLEDSRVRYCVRRKRLFTEEYPHCQNTIYIKEIADKLLKVSHNTRSSSIKKFFSDFFRISGGK